MNSVDRSILFQSRVENAPDDHCGEPDTVELINESQFDFANTPLFLITLSAILNLSVPKICQNTSYKVKLPQMNVLNSNNPLDNFELNSENTVLINMKSEQ